MQENHRGWHGDNQGTIWHNDSPGQEDRIIVIDAYVPLPPPPKKLLPKKPPLTRKIEVESPPVILPLTSAELWLQQIAQLNKKKTKKEWEEREREAEREELRKWRLLRQHDLAMRKNRPWALFAHADDPEMECVVTSFGCRRKRVLPDMDSQWWGMREWGSLELSEVLHQ
jgi:hypothetical protein